MISVLATSTRYEQNLPHVPALLWWQPCRLPSENSQATRLPLQQLLSSIEC